MNKITFTTLTALALSTAQAGYVMKVPLEGEIKFYEWISTDPFLGEWENTGSIYDCSNWSPEPSSITVNQAFTQIATDCKQNQTRTVQDREVEQISGIIRDSGLPYTHTQQITALSSREAVGTKETWVAISSTYTNWVNSGAVTSCTNWAPATSTVNKGKSFTQTATDCKQAQTRSSQNREQETTTLAIRNVGTPVTESQSITTSSTRTATGTKVVKQCLYDTYNYAWSHPFTYSTAIVWAGKTLFDNSWTGNTGVYSSMNIGGYKYSRGSNSPDYPGMSYYICREPI